MKKQSFDRKSSKGSSLTYLERQNLQEALKIYDHQYKIEYMQVLKEIILSLHALSDQKSLKAIPHVIEYTTIFLEDQSSLDRYFKFMKGHQIEKNVLGIHHECIDLFENLYRFQWDEKAEQYFLQWINSKESESSGVIHGKKTYLYAKEKMSFGTLLKMLKKDFELVALRENHFPTDLKDYIYLKSEEKFFEGLFNNPFKMFFYWLKSKIFKGAENPYVIKNFYLEIKNHVEKKFFKGFAQLTILDSQLLKLFLKQEKLCNFLFTLGNFRTKFLSCLNEELIKAFSMKDLIEIHKQLLQFDSITLKDSIKEHIELCGEPIERAYFSYFESLYDNKENNDLIAVLTEVFSSTKIFFESFYKNQFSKREKNNFFLEKEEFFRWLKVMKKTIDYSFFFRLYDQFSGEKDFWQLFFDLSLDKQMTFTLRDDNFIKILESSDLETLKFFYSQRLGIFEKSLIDFIEARLFENKVLSLKQLVEKYRGFILLSNPLVIPLLLNFFKEEDELFKNREFLHNARDFLSYFPQESLQAECLFLRSLIISEKDFSFDYVSHFLTWYPEVNDSLKKHGRRLALESIEELFLNAKMKVGEHPIKSSRALMSFLLGDKAEPIEHWEFINHFLVELSLKKTPEETLDYFAQIDASSLKSLTLPMRKILVKGIKKLFKNQGLTALNSTIIYLIENINKTEVEDLFYCPSRYLLHYVFEQSLLDINPISVDLAIKNLYSTKSLKTFKLEAKSYQPWSSNALHFMRTLQRSKTSPVLKKVKKKDPLFKKLQLSLRDFEKYALKKVYTHLQHSFLAYDMQKQSKLLIEQNYYGDVMIDTLAQQIEDYPYLSVASKQRCQKIAEHIFYATWADYLLFLLDNNQEEKFMKSLDSFFKEDRKFLSKTSTYLFEKAKTHYDEVFMLQNEKNAMMMNQRYRLN